MATRLPAEVVAALEDVPLTYAEVGATAGPPPPGYHAFAVSRVLSTATYDEALEALMTWQVHERAGLRVGASSPRVEHGGVVDMRLGPPRLGVRIPCRVVEVIDEPHAGGFAYGTLPGHPETGEERFEVRRRPDGSVAFAVTAFSRPASALARAGGPLSRWVQGRMTERYLRAADRPRRLR